ncbi:MAG TPA: SMP-30/gluconolactonase/LRE family protein [Pseudomonadales bacterium]|jgi:sugar lactone lactonase YvrE|nr:gluconolactonase [Gammaproteobacteria bacterium]MDP6024448.1 SMP-30/gluconolactonase/LRE family protein [Pseudomonadales bacterium]MDP6316939.1 SMP-30/gluconolactonase/LRE family protein [Pseudomonadales bacterium]MDP7313899.1 SMP-30/gluconolactonase/LRE family protein [Pseudomonadales bacterium]HJL60801.1 SMP-30/gluconolactonase/LRE family protein [Pseudomonadales bacterium]|tara:strand:- start:6291 stop:7133 length:843 start_codon:yes stop_codon:yes gene_type:complete
MTLKTLVENLAFSEGPRWHDGRLYYSDFYRHVVEAVDVEGNVEVIAEVLSQPSGLGWLPDGRLLIVSMLDRKLLRQEADGSLVEHADLNSVATYHCNDMVVDGAGRAYVGNFGFDIEVQGNSPSNADLAFVDADGVVSVAAEGIAFPNGTVITPDGKTLIIGETFAAKLTAFDIDEAGKLSNRRVWAEIGPHVPDGICLDEAGGIWVADPREGCVVRVLEGGEITETIDTGRPAFACMLGGEDRKRLFICTASGSGSGADLARDGCIETIDVEIPGAGWP